MKQLYSARNGHEAHELRLFLESQGIVVQVLGDNPVLESIGATAPASAPSVFVDEADFTRAAEVVQRFRSVAGVSQTPTASTDSPGEISRTSEYAILFEIAAVLALVWLPAMVRWMIARPAVVSVTFVEFSAAGIAQHLSWIAVLSYILYRSDVPWQRFGILRPRIIRDPVAGALIWFSTMIFFYVVYSFVTSHVDARELARFFNSRQVIPRPTSAEIPLLGLLVLIVGLSEELAFRGYLITRLEAWFGSTWKGVLCAALLFGSGHFYLGLGGCANACLIGMLFGFFFCKMRRLWPLALAHALVDLLALWPRA